MRFQGAMQSFGFFAWVHDHFLRRRDVKYLLLPALENAPLAVTGLWVALGHDKFWADPETHFAGYSSAWLILAATGVGGLISAGRAALIESGSEKISVLLSEQRQLLRLVGHVRVIVTAKSRRFAEALQKLGTPVDAGTAFLTITRPDEQIKEIVRNTYDYFYHSSETLADEIVSVSLMRWNDSARYLEFVECFPHTERPRTSPTEFGDTSTVAGRAFHTREMIICEDIANDSRYKRLSDQPAGSMFSYPMWDEFDRKVAFVMNVVSSNLRRFREKERKALDIPMRVFGERLLLENRLVELRVRVTKINGGAAPA